MKNKNGFTLIELLAIIVILAIIAVITVPIILNIIENSKKGAASDSAYGFKDAVNKAYVTKLSADPDYVIPDDTYTVDELKTQIGLSLSGKEPSSNSWVTIEKNNVTEGCLQYDEFKVEFTDGKVSNTEKSNCSNYVTNTNETWDKYYYYDPTAPEDPITNTWTGEFSEKGEWNVWIRGNTTSGNKQVCGLFSNGTECVSILQASDFDGISNCEGNSSIKTCSDVPEKLTTIIERFEVAGASCTVKNFTNDGFYNVICNDNTVNVSCSLDSRGYASCTYSSLQCQLRQDGTYFCVNMT